MNYRLSTIDTLRFVCAGIVLLRHIGIPLPEFLNPNTTAGLARTVGGLINHAFNAPAAVLVFFIISGLCIHFPYQAGKPLNIAQFYTRRMVRIGLPALIALIGYAALDMPPQGPVYGLFWSIICECVYYLLYPLLLILARRYGMDRLLVVSFTASLCLMALLHEQAATNSEYFAFGGLTWVLGLPVWLMGCLLAEQLGRITVPTWLGINTARVSVFMVAWVLSIAQAHIPLSISSFALTLNFFALLAAPWVGMEIAYGNRYGDIRWLELAGRWSYSLYITHPLVPAALVLTGVKLFVLPVLLMCLLFAYMFYALVEKPAHRLAYWLSGQLVR